MNLINNQERFKNILEEVPKHIRELFSFDEYGHVHLSEVPKINGLSYHEKAMVAFVMMIFSGNSKTFPKQQILENFGGMDLRKRQLIVDWCCNPFWV